MENHGKKNESTYLFSRKSEIHNSWILDEKKKKIFLENHKSLKHRNEKKNLNSYLDS